MNLNVYMRIRSFSTSIAVLAAGREARVMNKFLKGSSRKRSWFPSKDISADSLPYHFKPQKGEKNIRRITMLNKLFMKYISDILSTGEISNEIAGWRLEISKVKISPDFGTLSVYWVTKGTGIDGDIENTLSKNSRKLKHELTQLRVIGNVPTIQFVKDRSLSKIAEVDSILAKADFGDDFEPTDPSLNLLSEFTSTSKLPLEVQDKILSEDGIAVDPLPPRMAVDVLGLDHDAIMQKILRSMKKSHALHRHIPLANSQNVDMGEKCVETSELKGTEIQSLSQGNEACMTVETSDLKKFVAKRMALHSKMLKTPKNYQPEKELLSNETELLEEDEDFNDYELLNKNSRRLKELEIDLDNFDDLVEDNDSLFYRKDN